MTRVTSTLAESYPFRWVEGRPLFLLLRRREDLHYGGLWQGVTGQIREGETAVETVLRELEEETGLAPERICTTERVSSFYEAHADRITLAPVFAIEVKEGEVRLSKEHVEFRWVSAEDGAQLVIWEQQRQALIEIDRFLRGSGERLEWSEVKLEP